MSFNFQEGYRYFEKYTGVFHAALEGEEFGMDQAEYIDIVKAEIEFLEKSINDFKGILTPIDYLKGDIAEMWHSGTFNVDSAINKSSNRVFVNRSHEFASVDVSSNFSKNYGLKYYSNGKFSAQQQAVSVFQRFREYEINGGLDKFDEYLLKRNFHIEQDVLNQPIYSGQQRVIPSDQIEDARAWLINRINTENARRPEQVFRYKETLDSLTEKISDHKGNQSIELSKKESENIALLAKDGSFDASEHGVVAPELMSLDLLIKESLKAGLSAAIISAVLKVGPEVYRSIDFLVKNGQIDDENFKQIGFAALDGSSEGFVRGTISAAITAVCKSGLLGSNLKEISPSIIAVITVITMNAFKNAYMVATNKKTRSEFANELIRDSIILSTTLVFGKLSQALLYELPVLGYMLGSFIGSIVGSFVYDATHQVILSFCVDTGITMFGIVEQDYSLPDDIIRKIGIATFEYDSFEFETFVPNRLVFERFNLESFKPDNLDVQFLRRGVIGISKVGYI